MDSSIAFIADAVKSYLPVVDTITVRELYAFLVEKAEPGATVTAWWTNDYSD